MNNFFHRNIRQKKKGKYGSKKVEFNGIKFDSKKEKLRYIYLKDLEAKGKISQLKLQPKFVLQDGFRDRDGKEVRAITYSADFQYFEDNLEIVEDVKSTATAKNEVYRIKKKLFIFKYPELIFREFI